MTALGPMEFVPFLFLPVMPILVGTSLAILLKEDATTGWCSVPSCWACWRWAGSCCPS